jgi:flagellar biosynthesis anti-sigma factor FlgM
MSVKIGTDGIDNSNSEYIQRDIKRNDVNEKVPAHIKPGDKVEPSSNALDLKEIQIKTMSFPDVRPEKVEQIKMQLHSGTYNISPGKIAERLIEEAIELNTLNPPLSY